MKTQQHTMSPHDVAVLLKISTYGEQPWRQVALAESLHMSQSEVSKSLARSKYAGLIDASGKKVRKLALMELLQYGLSYFMPQQPGPIVRGVPTAHSANPLRKEFLTEEHYVWPYAKGEVKGQSIVPLYPNAVKAALEDPQLHELLALVDALRVGRAREKTMAIQLLEQRLMHGK